MPKVKETEKSNFGKTYSVLVVAPFLVYLAAHNKLNDSQRRWLMFAGLSLIVTVGYAYIDNEIKLNKLEKSTA